MKTKTNFTASGFTFLEAIVVIAILCVLLILIIPDMSPGRARAQRINCVNNERQISLAFKQWEFGDKFPMQVSVTNGGTMELVASDIVWSHFQVMSNELNTPKVLVCPADADRQYAWSFTSNFNNSAISYFVGVDAVDTQPQMFLIGDRNLSCNGTNLNCGLHEIWTNSPIAWTEQLHVKQGNVALADGSVQGLSNNKLREGLRATGVATNRLAIP